jgi:hypothetical protein
VKRVGAALALVVVLIGACGRSDLSREAAQDLQRRVATVRAAAEAGKPVLARTRLRALTSTVGSLVDQGLLDDQRAIEIVQAADAVRAQLTLLTPYSPSESPSPAVEEGKHSGEDDGDKGKGHDNGNGKD